MTVNAQMPSRIPTRIAFVGEAPGDEEVEKGRPFVGPSGRVFNALLRSANLSRDDFYVGNVFDEQIPENDLATAGWVAPARESRDGGFDDLPPVAGGFLRPVHRAALDRLAVEIARVAPTVVVPLGATALWAFTGQTDIGRMRGSIFPATYIAPGVKLVPTFHPMHVQHQWKFYSVVVGDFIKAADEAARGPAVEYPNIRLMLEPTIEEVEEWCQRCRRVLSPGMVSVDIETKHGQISCIALGVGNDAMCIPFIDQRNPNRSYWPDVATELRAREAVGEVLESPVPKLGQNFGGYDAPYIIARWGYRIFGMEHDTRLLSHALYAELPKDLAFMGGSYTNLGPWKTLHRAHEVKRDA